MTLTRYPRPCPIPGHPQDDAPAPLAPDSAWSRLRAWHLHAPAERLPLPLILIAWPSAWILHAVHVPGHVVTCAAAVAVGGHLADMAAAPRRTSPHPRLAADRGRHGRRRDRRVDRRGCHVRAARLARAPAVAGSTWPARSAATGGCAGTRPSWPPASAGTTHAAWTARKAEWHRIAHLIGLGDFHLQAVTATRLGEELLLTSAPGSELATRVAANSRPYAEKYAHLARPALRPGRHPAPPSTPASWSSRSGRRTRRSTARSPTRRWTRTRRTRTGSPSAASIRDPVPIGVIPETGEPMELVLFDEEGGKAVGVYSHDRRRQDQHARRDPRADHRDG